MHQKWVFLKRPQGSTSGHVSFFIFPEIARIDNEGWFLVRTASKLRTQLSHCDCQLCSAWRSLFSEPVPYCQSTAQLTNLLLWGILWNFPALSQPWDFTVFTTWVANWCGSSMTPRNCDLTLHKAYSFLCLSLRTIVVRRAQTVHFLI